MKLFATLSETLDSHRYLHGRISESGPDFRTYHTKWHSAIRAGPLMLRPEDVVGDVRKFYDLRA